MSDYSSGSAEPSLCGLRNATINEAEAEKATLISQRGLYLCRQRPTLPHTFACSTIGPAGLNFRVRDGNGRNPRGKITDNLMQLRAPSCELRACFCGPGTDAPASNDALQTFKEREDETSQLNRLGETRRTASLLLWQNFRRRTTISTLSSVSSRF